MTKRICSFPDCGRRHHANGYCLSHNQMNNLGRQLVPIVARARKSAADRFATKYEVDEAGCWNWLGFISGNGYGRFAIGEGATDYAHRWSYEHHIGPIPDGLVIDHVCRNRACVNPGHLEAVTQETNVFRGNAAGRMTHCKRGHEYTVANTYVWVGNFGDKVRSSRQCRTCRSEQGAARYLRNKSA